MQDMRLTCAAATMLSCNVVRYTGALSSGTCESRDAGMAAT